MGRSWVAVVALVVACRGGAPAGEHAVSGRSAEAAIRAAVTGPFVAPTSRAAWEARARAVRTRLAVDAALTLPTPPPAATRVARAENADAIVEEWLLDGFGGTHVPATLYVPRGVTLPAPAVLINGGHDGATGRRADGVATLARALVGRGVVVLTLDWWGMGSRFGADARHRPMGLRSALAGLDPSTMTLGEPLAALAWLRGRAEVDPARVGLAGQSGGGITTLYLVALDPGVAAAVVVDAVVPNAHFAQHGWGDPDGAARGALTHTSHGELLAMAAPRPVLVISGDRDGEAPTPGGAAEVERARAAYALYGDGAAAKLERTSTSDEHCWCAGKLKAAEEFLARVLGAGAAARAVTLPVATPEARAPTSDPRWPALLAARVAAPGPAAERAAAKARFAAWLGAGAAAPGLAVPSGLRPPAVLRVRDPAAGAAPALPLPKGTTLVRVTPAGLDIAALGGSKAAIVSQHASHTRISPLRLGVKDLAAVIAPLAARGGPVVLVGEGPQAALVCAAAAAVVPGVTGVVLIGLPATWSAVLALDAPDPVAYYVSFGLAAAVALEDLVGFAAPARLAWVGAAPPWAATVSGLRVFADGDVAAATAWALSSH